MQGRKAGRQEGKAGKAGRMGIHLSALLLFCLATAPSACVRAQAKITPDQPLEVPAPPPREVDVADSEPPAPVPLVTEPARNAAPARSRPTREPQRTEPARPDAPK